jgi:flavin-dependent dehydrogenase
MSLAGEQRFASRRGASGLNEDGVGRSARNALVIGGGLAGSALATWLAEAGRDVWLVEKSAGAHPKVCGEFISHEALHYLGALGVDPEALGAVPIESVRLAGQRVLATARLPFRALSLSRERLDEVLMQRAAQAGVRVQRGQRITALAPAGPGWSAQTDAGQAYVADDVFLATGKHDLYGWNRPAGLQNDLIAFKMNWRLAPQQEAALARHVELVLFAGGYAGLQPVENGAANLCLLVKKAAFAAAGGSWPALLAQMQRCSAHLSGRLAGAVALWERPLSLSSIPYGYVRKHTSNGAWPLGDQSAVIPSFAGDGMSIALHSARLAATQYLSGGTSGQYQRQLAHDVSRHVGLATVISRSLVHPRLRPLFGVAARLWPGVLSQVARSTRIRSHDLLG